MAGDDLLELPAFAGFSDFVNNVAGFGAAYGQTGLYQQRAPLAWGSEEVQADARKAFGTVWATCAAEVTDFPADVDAALSDEVAEGATNVMPGD